MIAANNCGFDSVGCDIDEKYCEIVLNRI